MKRAITLFIILFLGCSISAQDLTPSDLIILCGKKNLEQIDQFLNTKMWVYYDSQKTNESEQTVTYSYKKNSYSDKAQGWITIRLYDNLPALISYNFFNDKSYKSFKSGLNASGFASYKNEIGDNSVQIDYKNNGFFLQIEQTKSGYNTSYLCTLLKKGCHYDSENGEKKRETEDGGYEKYTLKDGKLEGFYRIYDSENRIQEEYTTKNGKAEGIYQQYDKNGKLAGTAIFKNGQLDGQYKKYYSNGVLKSVMDYSQGVADGKFFFYSNQGKLLAQGVFCNGNRTEWILYEDDGLTMKYREITKSKENRYALCRKKGLTSQTLIEFQEFSDNGAGSVFSCFIDTSSHGKTGRNTSLRIEDTCHMLRLSHGTIKENQRQGWWTLHNEKTGKLLLSAYYKNNKQQGSTNFYDDNGDLLAEIHYINGIKQGPCKLKTTDGKGWITGNYKNDKKDGIWSQESEGYTLEQNWENGVLNGKTTITNGKGIIIASIGYKDNKLDGTTILFNSVGKKTFELHYANGTINEVIDLRNDCYSITYSKIKEHSFTATYSSNDTTTSVTFRCDKKIFGNNYWDEQKLSNYIDSVWITNSSIIPNGDYSFKTSKSKFSSDAYGTISDGRKTGNWKYIFKKQNICLSVNYGLYSESYRTLDGLSYSGEFRYEEPENNFYELRQIKNGECLEKKTRRYYLDSDKRMRGEIEKADYFPIVAHNHQIIIPCFPDMINLAEKNQRSNVKNIPMPSFAANEYFLQDTKTDSLFKTGEPTFFKKEEKNNNEYYLNKYKEFIKNEMPEIILDDYYSLEHGFWSLVYLDDDSIPELYINCGMGGFDIKDDLLYINEGKVYRKKIDYLDEYLERRSLMLHTWGDGGDGSTEIFFFYKGVFYPVLSIFSEMINPSEYAYSLNGTTIDENEADKILKNAFYDKGEWSKPKENSLARTLNIHNAAQQICNCGDVIKCVNIVINQNFIQYTNDADFRSAVETEAEKCIANKIKDKTVENSK